MVYAQLENFIWYFAIQTDRLISATRLIGFVGRVFANGPGDLGSIPGHIIPKNLEMLLDTALLNPAIKGYASRIKWNNPGKGVAPSPTPRCSSY